MALPPGEKTRNRHQSHLVFQGGEGTQRGSNGDAESLSPSGGFRFEFWKARIGSRDLGLPSYTCKEKVAMIGESRSDT